MLNEEDRLKKIGLSRLVTSNIFHLFVIKYEIDIYVRGYSLIFAGVPLDSVIYVRMFLDVEQCENNVTLKTLLNLIILENETFSDSLTIIRKSCLKITVVNEEKVCVILELVLSSNKVERLLCNLISHS